MAARCTKRTALRGGDALWGRKGAQGAQARGWARGSGPAGEGAVGYPCTFLSILL